MAETITDEVIAEERKIWQTYLALTKDLLKFINKQDVETFNSLVPQRSGLIEKLEALPSHEYRKLEEFKTLAGQIKKMDQEIMYKARAWLIKSRRQNAVVRSYDLGTSMAEKSSYAFNRTY